MTTMMERPSTFLQKSSPASERSCISGNQPYLRKRLLARCSGLQSFPSKKQVWLHCTNLSENVRAGVSRARASQFADSRKLGSIEPNHTYGWNSRSSCFFFKKRIDSRLAESRSGCLIWSVEQASMLYRIFILFIHCTAASTRPPHLIRPSL